MSQKEIDDGLNYVIYGMPAPPLPATNDPGPDGSMPQGSDVDDFPAP